MPGHEAVSLTKFTISLVLLFCKVPKYKKKIVVFGWLAELGKQTRNSFKYLVKGNKSKLFVKFLHKLNLRKIKKDPY